MQNLTFCYRYSSNIYITGSIKRLNVFFSFFNVKPEGLNKQKKNEEALYAKEVRKVDNVWHTKLGFRESGIKGVSLGEGGLLDFNLNFLNKICFRREILRAACERIRRAVFKPRNQSVKPQMPGAEWPPFPPSPSING